VTDEPWRIEITRAAQRDLRRLDPQIRRRVSDALVALAQDPLASAALRRLAGTQQSRLRVGDWRVRLTLDTRDRVLVVMRVLPRGRAYRD
jgi:mRNA interferase RelE/StbE